MINDLDFSKLENPYVQVVWEDTPENFTQEKLKSVKAYFQKKYSTTSVNVITKLKKTEEVQDNVDVNIKGVYYYPYKGSLDIEDMLSKVQEALKEEFENVRDGNIDVVHFDISVF